METENITSFRKVKKCREEHGASDQEEEQRTQCIHTPLDRDNHDFDRHDNCWRIFERPEYSQQTEQPQDGETEEHRLMIDYDGSKTKLCRLAFGPFFHDLVPVPSERAWMPSHVQTRRTVSLVSASSI